MKRCARKALLVFCLCVSFGAQAQEQEIQQLLLDVEKLVQLKNILADLKNGYEIVSGGYQTIKNISEGNFNLHQRFLSSLLQVSPQVRKYSRIADIINAQVSEVKEYKQAFKLFKTSGQFTSEELRYISRVYSHLFQKSLESLDALATIITANMLRMSDAERLKAIDTIWEEAEHQFIFIQHFTNDTKVLALQRAKETTDVNTTRTLYGISY